MTDPRTRTYTWQDPAETLERARQLSGLEYLRAMARGELPGPPIAAVLGMAWPAPEDFSEGRAVFRLTPREDLYNPIGSVHGGVYATLLDSAVGCAVQTTLPAGVGYTTLELKVNYLRPLRVGGPEVQAVGQVVASTRQTAVAEGRLVDEAGKIYAYASTTCLILRP
jgi:uncharacterized protein (TIGR00369 family)